MKNKVAAYLSMSRIALVVLLAFSTCASRAISQSASATSPQSAEATPAPELVAADSSRVTPGGATFTVPAGWSMATGKDLVILNPPETDTHIAIFDSVATDAKSAVAAAWVAAALYH